ncbi:MULTISPECIES: hypothetical protein [unclassified Bradyrhizobium]|uniref:hypothetical protein n=1 Tax=Bradyrhizobium sp. USDA 4541 TaxID=2817704 RepID=UPI0020A2D61E|nr:hypothetical protein [Bradyrhizobium sp. USDA 4541]MCP1852840.1 hypothetical protein [Bradyrhizobium sp. USDA 4541]
MAKAAPMFATEAALCKRFIGALPEGWTAYPETGNWDILLVRDVDGFQIGIQAKLRMGLHVINQSLDEYGAWDADRMAPDCRAVLVPDEHAVGYELICAYIGLTIIRVSPTKRPDHYPVWSERPAFRPLLPDLQHSTWRDDWHEWAPAFRHRLPEYVPDVLAGSPSPVQLTSWKVAAIKIAVILEKRGYLLRSDFKHVNIDHRRWLPSGGGWLALDAGRYLRGPHFPNFKRQHPRVYEEIAGDYDKWKPADPLAPPPVAAPEPKQENLL